MYLLLIAALGIGWMLDGLEITIVGAMGGVLESPQALHLRAEQIGASAKMQAHATALKEIRIQTIAGNQPAVASEIDDATFWTCRAFLSHALTTGGQVFTLNCDPLLYWTLMHDDSPLGGRMNLAGMTASETMKTIPTWNMS